MQVLNKKKVQALDMNDKGAYSPPPLFFFAAVKLRNTHTKVQALDMNDKCAA
jgi:hypothetical protein